MSSGNVLSDVVSGALDGVHVVSDIIDKTVDSTVDAIDGVAKVGVKAVASASPIGIVATAVGQKDKLDSVIDGVIDGTSDVQKLAASIGVSYVVPGLDVVQGIDLVGSVGRAVGVLPGDDASVDKAIDGFISSKVTDSGTVPSGSDASVVDRSVSYADGIDFGG